MLTVDANVWVAAFDPEDRFHAPSASFLRDRARQHVALYAPAFMLVEVACALARRLDDDRAAGQAAETLRSYPLLRLLPLSEELLDRARSLGITRRLRGADALYAATATMLGSPLVSWDETLVERAGAVRPST